MAIHLNKPYRIIPTRLKRYEAHYQVPADQVLVVPVKVFGDEVLCDIRWEDSNGELQVKHNAIFVYDNLVPLDERPDSRLKELWDHYYVSGNASKSSVDAQSSPENAQ
jgi:hypothetical protein